jgi:hypothetical protein
MKKKKSPVHLSANNGFLFLFLLFAWSFSFAQPIMAMFGEQPVFLVAHELRGWGLIFATLILNFIPPLLLLFVIYIIGLISINLKEWLTRSCLFILLTLYFLPLVNNLYHVTAILLAFILSIISILLLLKIKNVRTFALWLAPTGLIFIIAFLFFSSAKQLINFQNINITNNKSQSDSPIFMFILDEFPSLSLLNDKNQIDESRFPNFAKLSNEITWYPNATTIAGATEAVIPAILTGIKPKLINRKLGTFEQYPDNLFTQFSETHNIHAIENTTRMCPPYLCKAQLENPYQLLVEDTYVSFLHRIYPINIQHKLPPINDRWVGFLREVKNEKKRTYDFSERLNTFNQFIDDIKKHPNNTVHFLHVLLPHAPWKILPDLKLYGFYEREGVAGEITKDNKKTLHSHMWGNDNWATQLSWRRHLLQIGAIDTLIGNAIDEIKSLKLYDNATIIIVGDHGSAFISGKSRRFAQDDNIPQIADIPLFIKYPNQKKNKVDQRFANNLDIFPTLLDVFSLNLNTELDGLSLLSDDTRSEPLDLIQEKRTITKLPKNYQSLIKQYLKTKKQTFPTKGWQGIFQPSDSKKFYSKTVKELNIQKVHDNAIKLLNPYLFKPVSIDSPYMPTYYRTQLLLDNYKANEILVTLNNKIVSHCFMFVHANKDCAGLIDPQDLMSVNELSLFNLRFFSVISEKDGQYTVDELLTENNEVASIIQIDENEVVSFESGKSLPIDKDSTYFGNATLKLVNNSSTYHLSGWAGDTKEGIPARSIYVFIDDNLVITAQTGVPKRHLVEKFGFKSLTDSGFQIPIPVTLYPTIENHSIRVFASNNSDSLAELNYHSDKKQVNLFKAFDKSTNRKILTNAKVLISKMMAKITNEVKITEIDVFNNDFPKLSAGDWHGIKNHVRWIGAEAYIGIPNTTGLKSLQFSIDAKPMIRKDIVDNQNILIYINNELVKSINFTKHKKLSFDIDINQNTTDIIVKLIMPEAISPLASGLSNDSRFLSFLVKDFKIKLI